MTKDLFHPMSKFEKSVTNERREMRLGAIWKYVTSLGGRGLPEKTTKCDMGEAVLSQRVMSLLQKYIVSKIVF